MDNAVVAIKREASSGMFMQSVESTRAQFERNGNGDKATAAISICGQQSNYTTCRMAKMNLAIRGADNQIGHGDTFHNDLTPTALPPVCPRLTPFRTSAA